MSYEQQSYGMTPSHPNVESVEERIRQLRLQAAQPAEPPPPPQNDVNVMQAAGQILAVSIKFVKLTKTEQQISTFNLRNPNFLKSHLVNFRIYWCEKVKI